LKGLFGSTVFSKSGQGHYSGHGFGIDWAEVN